MLYFKTMYTNKIRSPNEQSVEQKMMCTGYQRRKKATYLGNLNCAYAFNYLRWH